MRMRFWLEMAIFFIVVLGVFAIAPIPQAEASSGPEIKADSKATLLKFFQQVQGSRELVSKSQAVLVFPSVIKAGIAFGGEYGEGALFMRGKSPAYYNTLSASVGLQLGAQARTVILVFMTNEALDAFRRANGWKVGVDGSVTVISVSSGASIDTTRVTSPIVGFIFDGTGLMYNLSLEGSKISQIWR